MSRYTYKLVACNAKGDVVQEFTLPTDVSRKGTYLKVNGVKDTAVPFGTLYVNEDMVTGKATSVKGKGKAEPKAEAKTEAK